MEQELKTGVKLATIVTAVGLLGVSGWSLVTGKPFILSVVTLALAAAFGFFSYVDVKQWLKK